MHISVGDLLRDEASSHDSVFADFIKKSMQNSVIIPANLTIELLRKKDAQLQGPRVFVIDGFPRSLEQAREFEEKVCTHV